MALLIHPFIFSLLLLVLFIVTEEIGYRLALRNRSELDENRHEQITSSRDALGVLLSLLLGFTLAMALPRYDLRRDLVLGEANAIGTTALRAGLLPSPQKEKVHALLLSYTRTRLEFSKASDNPVELEDLQGRGKALQSQLWSHAEATAQAQPTPITSTFIQALNEMIDISEKRMAALENRIPVSIWLMLTVIGMMTCLMFGFALRSRSWLISVVVPLMIAFVVGLIADLDSPRRGLLRADLRSLERVERDLAADQAGSHPEIPH